MRRGGERNVTTAGWDCFPSFQMGQAGVAQLTRYSSALIWIRGQFLRRQFTLKICFHIENVLSRWKVSFTLKIFFLIVNFPILLPIFCSLPGPANWPNNANWKFPFTSEIFFHIGNFLSHWEFSFTSEIFFHIGNFLGSKKLTSMPASVSGKNSNCRLWKPRFCCETDGTAEVNFLLAIWKKITICKIRAIWIIWLDLNDKINPLFKQREQPPDGSFS